jgi:LEA14-like dessication related protein
MLSDFILGVILIFVMLNVVMLSVIMLSVVMLSVVMPNVAILNVMAPVVTLSSRECLGQLKLQFEYHSFIRLNIATCVPLQYSLFLNKVRIFEIRQFQVQNIKSFSTSQLRFAGVNPIKLFTAVIYGFS